MPYDYQFCVLSDFVSQEPNNGFIKSTADDDTEYVSNCKYYENGDTILCHECQSDYILSND